MKRMTSFGVMVGAISLFLVMPVQAANQLIVAHVQPVRYILVDNHDIIQSIHSNTDQNITPVVYRDSVMITQTPHIYQQYEQILHEHPWAGRYGEVYSRATPNEGFLLHLLRAVKSVSVMPLAR